MTINIFINEESLEGQFVNSKSAENAFLSLLRIIDTITEITTSTINILYDKSLFNKLISRSCPLGQIFKNKDIKYKYQQSKQKWNEWNDHILHNISGSYIYNNKEYVGTSMAEAYTYTDTKKEITILLNFFNSSINSPQINILYRNKTISIHSLSEEKDFCELLKKYLLFINKYDREKSKSSPCDSQTILADTSLFQPTQYKNHRRRIYKRIDKDQYWCVDNLHYNGSAHLEVFNSNDLTFIGKCDIDDINAIDTHIVKKNKGRVIQFDD